MTWQDRVQDAVIETAAGDRFVFEFLDLSSSRDERTTVYKFAGLNGDYIQKRSSGSNVFPITLFFSGPDCDQIADTFEAATKDPRPLVFTHPLRAQIFTVHLLSLQRVDALATSANEVAFSLTLHQTIDLAKPLASENAPLFVDNTRNTLELLAADYYDKTISLKLPDEITAIKNTIQGAIGLASFLLSGFNIAAGLLAEFEAIKLTAESLVTTFETNISQLASVTQGLINFPTRALESVEDKISFYTQLLEDYKTSIDDPENATLLLSSAITGYAQATLQGNESFYVTKNAVFDTIEQILNYYSDYVTILDGFEVSVSGFEQDIYIRTLLANITSTAANNLNGVAFAAKQERFTTLSKNEDVYVLVYRLLGADDTDDLDAKVASFLEVNNILDFEMFELKQNTTYKYYV